MINQCCGNCKWWDKLSAQDKAGRVLKNKAAECNWPIPPLPYSARMNTIRLMYTSKNDGIDCKCWENWAGVKA